MVFDSIGRVRICCGNAEYILGDICSERLDDIWNGARLARIREALKAYDLSLGCAVCHHKIAAGVMEGSSLRTTQLIAQKFEEFEIEPDAPYWPKHLEFHLSNKCNLQCVTCFGEFSSVIRQKRDKLPPHTPAYGDQFFDDLRKYLPRLVAAQFLGGEPFLIPEMYRVWDMLIEDQLQPACHVTTNGTVFGAKVERVLDKLPMSVSVSMDGVTAKTFEAIRLNAKFERVLENFRRFKESCRSRGQYIGINFTLSRLNWHEFVDFLLFAEAEDVDVSASEVYFPEALSLFSMDLADVRRVVETLERQDASVGHELRRNRQLLQNRIRELRHHLEDKEERETHHRSQRLSPPSLVEEFKGVSAPQEGMDAIRAQAWQRLKAWSPEGSATEIVADVNDIIVEADLSPASPLGWSSDLVGRPLTDWLAVLTQHLGAAVVHLEMDKQPTYQDRTLRFEGGEVARTVLRIVTLPCYDAEGTFTGARALLMTKDSSPQPTPAHD